MFDGAIRATARVRGVMIGAGVGVEEHLQSGYYNGIDDKTDASETSTTPLAELHAGFSLPRIGAIVPEVMAMISFSGEVATARFAIGARL